MPSENTSPELEGDNNSVESVPTDSDDEVLRRFIEKYRRNDGEPARHEHLAKRFNHVVMSVPALFVAYAALRKWGSNSLQGLLANIIPDALVANADAIVVMSILLYGFSSVILLLRLKDNLDITRSTYRAHLLATSAESYLQGNKVAAVEQLQEFVEVQQNNGNELLPEPHLNQLENFLEEVNDMEDLDRELPSEKLGRIISITCNEVLYLSNKKPEIEQLISDVIGEEEGDNTTSSEDISTRQIVSEFLEDNEYPDIHPRVLLVPAIFIIIGLYIYVGAGVVTTIFSGLIALYYWKDTFFPDQRQ